MLCLCWNASSASDLYASSRGSGGLLLVVVVGSGSKRSAVRKER